MADVILDLEEFRNRVQDDKELLFELLDIFVSDFPEKRRQLGEAIVKKDCATVEHVAHFLKGSCSNISVNSLRSIFCSLEEMGKNQKIDGAENYLDEIDAKFEELVIYIGELRSRL